MAISKANFNSFNVTPTASKFITFNSSNNGLAADDVGGSLVLISTQTASSSSSLSFTSGIDSTYKEYIFKFINLHPATNSAHFTFNMSVDGGSNYNVTKTTTAFHTYHGESGSGGQALAYQSSRDLAQSTDYQELIRNMGNQNDEGISGFLHLFDPSNTTFVKNFIGKSVSTNDDGGAYIYTLDTAGYGNTTSAINAVDFKASTGNIDSGTIDMYGVL